MRAGVHPGSPPPLARPRVRGRGRPAAVVANLVVAGLALAGRAPAALALALAAALAAAVLTRPQRGLLLLAALAPFNGLLLVAHLPAWVSGWKEALVLVTLAATMVAPPGARAGARPLPGWWPAAGALFGLGLASAAVVGGLQALVGMKVTFFYVL